MECQQEDCVSLLLEDKADPNAKDKAGQTCLHYAAREGLVQIIRVLTSSEKTDIDVRDQVPPKTFKKSTFIALIHHT